MSNIGFDREFMLETYNFETTELLEQLEEIIVESEKNKIFETEAINEVFRIMHTIKGSASMMEFNNITALAHSLEDLFYFIRENKSTPIDFENLFDLVLLGIDFIKTEFVKIQEGIEVNGISKPLVLKITEYLDSMKNTNNKLSANTSVKKKEDDISLNHNISEDIQMKYVARIFYEEGCEMENIRAFMVVSNIKEISSEVYYIPADIMENEDSVKIIRENGFLICFSTITQQIKLEELFNQTIFLKQLELFQVKEYPKEIKDIFEGKEIIPKEIVMQKEEVKEEEQLIKTSKQQSIISVKVSKLDMLLDLVGEIVISEVMVTKNSDLEGLQLNNFNKASRQLGKLTNELQDIVMAIRMVPISFSFQKMNRIVRDMSRKLNKKINLEIIGEETEVDKNIIDHISDPLMHLVRNSLDHGIEEKQERIKLGKSEIGKVSLGAKNEGSSVHIIVSDDGKGLDRKKIYNKAKSQGLTTKSEKELTDKEIFAYIFEPGFSTNESITEYSGRGVGMDVVKKNIDNIGGTISIESTIGIGTSIYIKIPLTLAIIDGMEVAVGKSKYTIPITAIKETFKSDKNSVIADSDGNEIIMRRGECYQVIRIHKLFNIKNEITYPSDGIMVMVEGNSKLACLFVDRLIGEQQVVVKLLPIYIKKVEGIAGCTILGDGNISLILDVNEILNK